MKPLSKSDKDVLQLLAETGTQYEAYLRVADVASFSESVAEQREYEVLTKPAPLGLTILRGE